MAPRSAVEISTFGPFSITLGDRPLEFSRRAPRKQLQLLKVLIALGGQGVPTDQIAEAVWPDADGDRAQQSLETTLSRLRGLLAANALRVRDGRLSIDEGTCRVDALEFRRLVDACEQALNTGDTVLALEQSEQALGMYGAPFLEGEFEPAEIIPAARTRLNDIFRRHVLRMGRVLTGLNRIDGAIQLYGRALAIDACDEEICCALMEAALAAGRFTEALAAYDALRQALHQRYELTPGDDTEALHQQLLEAVRARRTELTPQRERLPRTGAEAGPGMRPGPSGRETPASAAPERRPVTVIAARLTGYTELLERLDVEEMEALLAGFREETRQIVHNHGGVLNGFSGGGMTALFGVAPAHDDDPVRAVRTALTLRTVLAERMARGDGVAGTALRLRVGIATGLHLVAAPGAGRDAYQLTGAAASVAADLENLAEPDAILITADVQRRVAEFFTLEPLPSVSLGTRGKLASAYRVVGETPVRTRIEAAERRGFTPFVGRGQERALLDRCVDRTLKGWGQFVVVSGEAGVGKSRLLHELRQSWERRGIAVLEGRCQTYGAETAYLPFLDALRRALDLADDDAPETRHEKVLRGTRAIDPTLERYLPHLLHLLSIPSETHRLPGGLEGEALRRELEEALAALFTLAASHGSLLLVLEDWHWADEASHSALRNLIGLIARYPLMVVVLLRPEAARQDWGHREHLTQIDLRPLEASDTADMFRHVLRTPTLPAGLMPRVHERTGGNALFNEEMAHALLELGMMEVADGEVRLLQPVERIELPETVQATLRARLDRLQGSELEVLRLAAVIGREFDRAVLERIAPPGVEVGAALERLARQDLIRPIRVLPQAEYLFKHALTQQVVYDTLLYSQRKQLHEKVAREIEALRADRLEECYEILAYHYEQSDSLGKAVEYLELAAKKAVGRQLLSEATRQYRTAIQLLDESPMTEPQMRRRIRLSLELGHIGSTYPSDAVYGILLKSEDLAHQLEDDRLLAAVALNLGGVARLAGDIDTARRHLTRSIELAARAHDEATLRIAEANFGQTLFYAAQFEAAIGYLERSIPRPDAAFQAPIPATRGNFLALQYTMTGDFGKAEQLQAEALRAARAERDLIKEQVVQLWASFRQSLQGRWVEALEALDATIALGKTTGVAYIEGYARCGRGRALFMIGQDRGALDESASGLAMLHDARHRLALSFYHAAHAELCALNGEPTAARQHAARALEIRDQGEYLGEVLALRALALAEASDTTPDWELAATRIEASLRLAEERGQRPDLAVGTFRLAELCHARGDLAAARRRLDELTALLAALEMPGWTAQAEALRTRIEAGAPFPGFAPRAG